MGRFSARRSAAAVVHVAPFQSLTLTGESLLNAPFQSNIPPSYPMNLPALLCRSLFIFAALAAVLAGCSSPSAPVPSNRYQARAGARNEPQPHQESSGDAT